jgi:hypothetical protein
MLPILHLLGLSLLAGCRQYAKDPASPEGR